MSRSHEDQFAVTVQDEPRPERVDHSGRILGLFVWSEDNPTCGVEGVSGLHRPQDRTRTVMGRSSAPRCAPERFGRPDIHGTIVLWRRAR